MADILKITTPLQNRTAVNPNKPVAEANGNLRINDLTSVTKSQPPVKLPNQNGGLVEHGGNETILANLLKIQ